MIVIASTIVGVFAEVSVGILYACSVFTNETAWLGVQFCAQLFLIFLCLFMNQFLRNFASLKGFRTGIPRFAVIVIKWYMLTG